MLIYLALFMYFVSRSSSDVIIKDTGIASVNEGDVAIIFFLTLENMCDDDVQISVSMIQCCERTVQSETDCESMYLIGGNMGILYKSYTRNVTLIYPNLYFSNRQGVCTVSVKYKTHKYEKILTKEITFQTNNTNEDQNQCKSVDMDYLMNCSPVDCVIKYSGGRSFFNPSLKSCEFAQICLREPTTVPTVAYSWIRNECIDLNEVVTKFDLELLESNQADTSDDDSLMMSNGICHHGDADSSGQCQCQVDWKTTLTDDVYEPSLPVYHMCNIESEGWNCVNKNRIQTTAIIIAIFSLTIATKILILMCILNWCYKHFRNPKKIIICTDTMDPEDRDMILVDTKKSSLEKCICDDLKKNRSPTLFSEVVNVSYYPCAPSTVSSLRVSVNTEKSKKCCSKCNSRLPTNSTSSSTVPISFETETDTSTEGDSNATDEDDYEIEFGEEQDFCGDDDCPQSMKRSDGRATEDYTDYTTSNDGGSKKGSKKSQDEALKSKSPSRKTLDSTKDRTK